MDSFLTKPYTLTILLALPSAYLWNKLFKSFLRMRRELEEDRIFHQRHNCVVMYSNKRITGWPPHITGIEITANNLTLFAEPFIYFIETAKRSLDIAMMMMGVPIIFERLHMAAVKGIKIRILLNLSHSRTVLEQYRSLKKLGVQITFYVGPDDSLSSIMHCKYMVKDFDEGCGGFLATGSMNLSSTSTFINNFEDFTFTSSRDAVCAFQKNFEECWDWIRRDNLNVFNKNVLGNYKLI